MGAAAGSASDLKPVVASDRDLGRPHQSNLGATGALFTPKPHFIEWKRLAFRLNFHSAIGKIAHPAAETKLHGASPAGLPKAHPLNVTLHQKTPALQ